MATRIFGLTRQRVSRLPRRVKILGQVSYLKRDLTSRIPSDTRCLTVTGPLRGRIQGFPHEA